MMGKEFYKTKVFSRNFITDWVQGIRNMFGLRLIAYENIINKGTEELMRELPQNKKWFKIDIEQIGGGFAITIYGETK